MGYISDVTKSLCDSSYSSVASGNFVCLSNENVTVEHLVFHKVTSVLMLVVATALLQHPRKEHSSSSVCLAAKHSNSIPVRGVSADECWRGAA